jgi:hypothetical protein
LNRPDEFKLYVAENRAKTGGESLMSVTDPVLDVFLTEYERLKAEQTQRIGFRDNLLYVTLITLGGVLSFALSNPNHVYAVLVIPWACTVLGWQYVVNDEKISAIGRYIRSDLADNVIAKTHWNEKDALFGWEVVAHRNDERRIRRKLRQWIVDELTFVFSGYIALVGYLATSATSSAALDVLCAVEAVLLLVLAIEIYALWRRSRL